MTINLGSLGEIQANPFGRLPEKRKKKYVTSQWNDKKLSNFNISLCQRHLMTRHEPMTSITL